MGKYASLSYATKQTIVKYVDENPSVKKKDVAKKFNIPATTLSTFLKKKDLILSEASKNIKRKKKGEFPELDECVLKWLKECRSKHVPISGEVLKEKGAKFAKILGNDEFRCSNGWLDRFKKRNGIVFKKVCGESGAVAAEVCDD